jgi:arogenate/prephenate dehydratase
MLKVSFQGECGSYSHEAALAFFADNFESLPFHAFEGVFDSVASGEADYGLVPIENSLVGSIHRNYDLLLKHDLKVVGERNQRIVHALIALPKVTLRDIRNVYSHAVALEQCQQFLDKHPEYKAVASYDTAGAVKMLKEDNHTQAAAIAGRYAAEYYGLPIIAEGIQDEPDNFTRFLILSKQPAEQTRSGKTSIVFALKNVPGALFKALSVFALHDLDLTKIESRPLRKRVWEYYFYLDFVGHINDEAAKNAIYHMREITTFLKILGSYPIALSEKEDKSSGGKLD